MNDMQKARKSVPILLVDDSPSDVMIAKEALALSKLVNEIYVAKDGEEALDFVFRRGNYTDAPRPGIVLLDLNLPKKSGREVLAEIKADPILRSIPVIILSTSKADEDISNSYCLHANCYITKPVDFDQFIGVVQSLQDYWIEVVSLPTDSTDCNEC